MPTSTQGTQAWDRYAYVNGNPVRYNDPTGHDADCGIGNPGSNCVSSYAGNSAAPATCQDPTATNNGGALPCTYDDGAKDTCQSNFDEDCLPAGASCILNRPCDLQPIDLQLHPTDSLIPPMVGVVYIYDPNGNIIGYYPIRWVPDGSSWSFDTNGDNSLNSWTNVLITFGLSAINGLGKKVLGSAICSVCAPIFGVYSILDLLNNSIVMNGKLVTGQPIYLLPSEPLQPFNLP